MLSDAVIWHEKNGDTTCETSYRCFTMRKVITGYRRKVSLFIDSVVNFPNGNQFNFLFKLSNNNKFNPLFQSNLYQKKLSIHDHLLLS